MQRKRPLEEDVKIATVTMHAPPDVKTALRQSAHVYGSSFAKMEAILESYLKTGKTYDARGVAVQDRTSGGSGSSGGGGSSPMEIGAVQHQPWKQPWKGKGKGKEGKGKKGKDGKGKGKDGKGKKGKDGKGKGKDGKGKHPKGAPARAKPKAKGKAAGHLHVAVSSDATAWQSDGWQDDTGTWHMPGWDTEGWQDDTVQPLNQQGC